MRIKSYLDFIKEEFVWGLDKLNKETANIFKDVFNGDISQLRQFLQINLPNQNLKYAGAGCIGLAFNWYKPKRLNSEFTSEKFIGKDITDSKEKIIKFTADLGEAGGAKKLVELCQSGEIPGFAQYYWIKEIDIPEKNWWSGTLGPPTPWQQMKKGDSFTYSFTGGSGEKNPKEIHSREGDMIKQIGKEKYKEVVDKSRRDAAGKMKKAYIICLEKVKMIDDVDQEMTQLISNLMTSDGDRKNLEGKYLNPNLSETILENRLSNLYNWIKNDEEVYKEDDFVRLGLDKAQIMARSILGLTKECFFGNPRNMKLFYIWKCLPKKRFLDFSLKMINLYRIGKENGIPTSDIHGGNIGWRGDELVAFDCM